MIGQSIKVFSTPNILLKRTGFKGYINIEHCLDKADKSTRSRRNFSPANTSLKNDKESEDTPGTPATAVRNTLAAVKTPGKLSKIYCSLS